MTSPPGDRRARRQAARAEARRADARRSSGPRWLLPGLIAAALVVAAVLAFVLPGVGGPGTGGSSTLPPGASAGASGSAIADVPVISGTALPRFGGPANDPAVGQPAPKVTGADFDGAPVSIEADGRPTVVLFLAHWCPHCQAAVPLIQSWVGAGGVPDGVDLVSVATGIDAAAPNYPPDAWLDREGWTVPVIVDPTNTVATAYGLASYPFWVFIGPDGNVRARAAGEIPIPDLEATIRALTAS